MTGSLGARFAVWWLRRRTVGWGWLLPMAALQVTDHLGRHSGAATWLPLLVGVVAGAAWQVLSPRDLVDRLTLLASMLLVAGVLQAVVQIEVDIFPAQRENWAVAGVVVGLVFTTHAYRSRRLVGLATRQAVREAFDDILDETSEPAKGQGAAS